MSVDTKLPFSRTRAFLEINLPRAKEREELYMSEESRI